MSTGLREAALAEAEPVIAAGEGAIPEASALERLAAARVALLGERHDDAADHAWQARLVAAIADRGGGLAVGFEMFPRRVQPVLDAFVAGRLDRDAFLEAVGWREVWGFDPGLYDGLFGLCRERGCRCWR
jgi:uncharacterized iron-regulated protein